MAEITRSEEEIVAACRLGMAVLDEKCPIPDWRRLINWPKVNMASPETCMLGQIGDHLPHEMVDAYVVPDGIFPVNIRYNVMCEALGFTTHGEDEAEHGFDVSGDESYEFLKSTWRHLVDEA